MQRIVGTAGHIDHGKTALVKALTGIDADRLPEEKRRGITVDLGFAEMSVGDAHFGFVDVPGHEKFIRNMLAGASGIDIVLLVVAADEGVMPQTREHFEICRLLDIKRGIIALTKSDLVDADALELARLDVAELVANSFLENAAIVAVSSKNGEGIDELRQTLLDLTNATATSTRREKDLIARLPIDRSFSMKGFGTIVTGTLHSGEVDATTQLELLPQGRSVRVRGLQTHGESADIVHTGQRVAVNLANISQDEIERGMSLAESGALRATQVVDAEIQLLKDAPRSLRSRSRVRVHIGTAEILARVHVLNEKSELAPGSKDLVQIRFESPTVAIPGERLIIRSYSPQVTIGGGVVIDNSPERHRRREFPTVRDQLVALKNAISDPRNQINLLIRNVGTGGTDIEDLQTRTGYRRGVIEDAVTRLGRDVIRAGMRLIARDPFEKMKHAAVEAVTKAHEKDALSKGVSRESLVAVAFPYITQTVVDSIFDSLQADGVLAIEGDLIRLVSHSATLSAAEQAFMDKLVAIYYEAGLEAPKLSDATTQAAAGLELTPQVITKLVRLAVDDGRIIKISEEFYFDAASIDALTNRLRERGTTEFDVPAFKELAGVSRKYAIPLLEYFDRTHVTARVGDKRVVIK